MFESSNAKIISNMCGLALALENGQRPQAEAKVLQEGPKVQK